MSENHNSDEQSGHKADSASKRLAEVAILFLKLGLTAFGGPAAHIAIMHTEVVKRRRWLDDRGFLDLLGITNLIPGPNSTEMAIHIGFLRAGYPGLILGGICFMLPAVLITMAFARSWAHSHSRRFYGHKPARAPNIRRTDSNGAGEHEQAQGQRTICRLTCPH